MLFNKHGGEEPRRPRRTSQLMTMHIKHMERLPQRLLLEPTFWELLIWHRPTFQILGHYLYSLALPLAPF